VPGWYAAAVDFDGTLVEKDAAPLRWRPGAREFLLGAVAAGVPVVIHTCRATPCPGEPGAGDAYAETGAVDPDALEQWALLDEMRAFLRAEGVWGLVPVWEGPGKPRADRFVDDRAEFPSFVALAAELGVQLPHEPGRPQALGLPGPQAGGDPGGGPSPAGAVPLLAAPAGP